MRLPILSIGALAGAAAGFAISLYLTAQHYAVAPLVCNLSGFSCERVLTSVYATIPFTSLPTASLGLPFFLLLALLLLLRLFHPDSLLLSRLALGLAFLGLLFALLFVYFEVVLIGAYCLWCTLVHILLVLIFLTLLYQRSSQSA